MLQQVITITNVDDIDNRINNNSYIEIMREKIAKILWG